MWLTHIENSLVDSCKIIQYSKEMLLLFPTDMPTHKPLGARHFGKFMLNISVAVVKVLHLLNFSWWICDWFRLVSRFWWRNCDELGQAWYCQIIWFGGMYVPAVFKLQYTWLFSLLTANRDGFNLFGVSYFFQDDSLLEGKLTLRIFPPGTFLTRQGDQVRKNSETCIWCIH